MSFDLNATGFSDLHLHINMNLTIALHDIFLVDKNDREKLGKGIRSDLIEELAEVFSARSFLNKETDCHAVVQEELYGERQREVEYQGLFWDLCDTVWDFNFFPMYAFEMGPILVMPSVLFGAASLTALILIDPKVTIIVLS
jgi:hypothetical protein